MLDLMRDPLRTPYEFELLAPDIKTAAELAAKLKQLPEVYAAITAQSWCRRTRRTSSRSSRISTT